MIVEQVSVFLENRAGRLQEVAKLLEENNINIRALCVADSSDFGVLRMIVNDTNKAISILKGANFSVAKTPVIAVKVEDEPGGLAYTLSAFLKAGLNVEYTYASLTREKDKAILIFKIENVEQAIDKLSQQNIEVLTEEEVKKI
ncbi:MAG: amino acid-binding protein [Campylobacterota bacterium]|nr:amino acid-binding protein [Campylobacterota bacterium]